jgi:hypothetical protein
MSDRFHATSVLGASDVARELRRNDHEVIGAFVIDGGGKVVFADAVTAELAAAVVALVVPRRSMAAARTIRSPDGRAMCRGATRLSPGESRASSKIDFGAVQRLSPEELDALPYGLIRSTRRPRPARQRHPEPSGSRSTR